MEKIYLNLKNIRAQSLNGVVIALCLLLAVISLSYVLFHNPHKDLHTAIFKTADNIRDYYRDQPNYWKLSTETATAASLVDKGLKQTKFVWHIGQGAKGDTAMPNDNSFDIALNKLNKSACINLSELAISKKHQLSLLKITVTNDAGSTEFAWGDEDHPLPIDRYATRRLCTPDGNTVIWTFQ